MEEDNYYTSNSIVYVCIEETPDDRNIIKAVFDNEDSAREWIREEFLKFKNGSQANYDEPLNDTDFSWYKGKTLEGYKTWECYYLNEPYGWCVVQMNVLTRYSKK